MSRLHSLLAGLGALAALSTLSTQAETAQVRVTVSRANAEKARNVETVVVPYAEILKQMPGLLFDHVAVRDAASGQLVDSQVTNFNPELRPAVYNEILFQVAFKPGQASAEFIVENSPTPVVPAVSKVFARHVPERLDDFAFENDRIAHRMYGPGLATPAAGKSLLIASGIDVWVKRVSYPIVDRWYLKGHDAYHKDSGEGMDLYDVGNGRGCGGTGIWDNNQLYISYNWKTAKVIANGPIRSIFELAYDAWDANGTYLSELKRFTVDAGSNLHRVDSSFRYNGKKTLTLAFGLSKHDKAASAELIKDEADKSLLALWENYKTEGQLGTAVLLPASIPHKGYAENKLNHLLLTEIKPGDTVTYYVGAGWDKSGHFSDRASWENYLKSFASNLSEPLKVSISSQP